MSDEEHDAMEMRKALLRTQAAVLRLEERVAKLEAIIQENTRYGSLTVPTDLQS